MHHGYHTWAPGAQKRVVLGSSHWRLEGTILWGPYLVSDCTVLQKSEMSRGSKINSDQSGTKSAGGCPTPQRKAREFVASLLCVICVELKPYEPEMVGIRIGLNSLENW